MSFQLGVFALVGVMMLVLSSLSVGYLIRVKNKTRASYGLLWFFVCVILSSIATILTNTGTAWDWAFAPSQDAFLIVGGVFLLQYAYYYPSNDQKKEARRVMLVYGVLALIVMGYALTFAVKFLSNVPAQFEEVQAIYYVTPLSILFIVFIFLRRSLHWSATSESPAGHEHLPAKTPVSALFKHPNGPALALRNFGLALSLALLPAWITLVGFLLPKLISSFLFNFGVVIAIGAIMLAYLNYAPEPSKISARFIGVSLVTSMLVLGAASIWVAINLPDEQVHGLVLTFIALVFINTFFIIAIFPYFFRAALLEPINILLDGVQAANDGDLDVQVEVRYDDEVGLLARSFNRMISSLKSLTGDLQNTALVKEREVTERTLELVKINQRLVQENAERVTAEARLDRMLQHEQALASFSQVLLVTVTEEADQKRILTEALEHLRKGTQASRAYVFRNFMDPAQAECHALFAETCGPGVTPALPNSFNQKISWSILPQAIPFALRSGNSIGGLTERIFAGHPFKDAMLAQSPPLYALLLFPIFIDEQWWGMMGFDDCEGPREWGESEVLLLRTASDMLGRSIQRWQLQRQLVDTLEQLEERVVERTISLSETNVRLNTEMTRREQYQQDLEQRLNSERMLARASVQLVETTDIQDTMEILLRDLGDVIQAEIVCMVFFDPGQPDQLHQVYTWRDTSGPLFDSELIHSLLDPRGWLWDQLRGFQTVYFADLAEMPQTARSEQELLMKMQMSSFVAMPIKLEDRTAGVALCGNFLPEGSDISNSLQFIQVFSNLLSGQVQREELLRTLEKRVAEQARELSNLYAMTLLGGESREIADILQPALFRIQEVSSSEAACIHFYSAEQQTLSLVAHHGIPQQQLPKLENIPVEGDFTDWLDDFVSNAGSRQNSSGQALQSFSLPGFRTLVFNKLRAGGQPRGMITCYRISDQPYTPFQYTMLEIMGDLLGVVVENQSLTCEAEKLATLQERQRLARELHDAVSQSIYSLTLFARSAKDAVEDGNRARLLDNLEQLEITSLSALKEMRLLLYQLRSMALADGGLAQAVEARFDLVERRSGIRAGIELDERIRLSPQLEQECFRIITEALNNSLYYAGASEVSVKLHIENEQFLLVVEDDGIGFDSSHVRTGLGLENMRERAAALNGYLEVISHPGQGTCIRFLIGDASIQAGENT
jgi:nitrate/nitrite-specific signal transduction histidine kinase